MGKLFFLLGCLCYGIINALWKKPQHQLPLLVVIIIKSIFAIMIFAVIVACKPLFSNSIQAILFTQQPINNILLAKAVGWCAINYLGLVFFSMAVKSGTVLKTVVLSKIGVPIALLVSVLFYREPITQHKIVECLLLLLAFALMEKINLNKGKINFSSSFWWILLAYLFWATDVFFVPYIKAIGALYFSVLLETVVLVCSLLFFTIQYQLSSSIEKKNQIQQIKINGFGNLPLLFIVGICTVGGILFIKIAYLFSEVSNISLLALSTPIIAIVIALIYYKEKLTPLQWAGLLLSILAVLFL